MYQVSHDKDHPGNFVLQYMQTHNNNVIIIIIKINLVDWCLCKRRILAIKNDIYRHSN